MITFCSKKTKKKVKGHAGGRGHIWVTFFCSHGGSEKIFNPTPIKKITKTKQTIQCEEDVRNEFLLKEEKKTS